MIKQPGPPLTVGRLLLLLALAAVPMPFAFANDQQKENRQLETWRIALNLQASKLLPSAVQWAICDKDPVTGFKARIKKFHRFYQEQLREAENDAARQEKRKRWIALQWDWGFKEIPADRLNLLTSNDPNGGLTSNEQDGTKWIVTKISMTKGKPVCWSIPVTVRYGEAIKVRLTEKNVFDLESVADSATREAAASKVGEPFPRVWRIQLILRVPGSAPFEVTYAIFDEDPIPAFKAFVKKWQANRRANQAVKGEERQEAIAMNLDAVFRKIRGDRLFHLKSSRFATFASNGSDGKKWVVTKLVKIKGKPVCWYLPVEVKTGKMIKVTLAEDNAFDLGSVFDSALRERGRTK